MLKLSFPINARDCKAVYDIAYGHIQKPADGQEEPGQQWVCVYGQDQNKIHAVSILNDCKYSFDILDNDLRMTILRSPLYADHFGERDEQIEYMDQGIHYFNYEIVAQKGNDYSGIVRYANELNNKPFAIVEKYHEEYLPMKVRGIDISEINIIASVFKRAENDDGYVLRCYETNGVPTKSVINLLLLGRNWTSTFKSCEIKTFRIPDEVSLPVVEIAITELEKD